MVSTIGAALVAAILAFDAPQDSKADVKFRWAFGALTRTGDAEKLVRVTDDITLRTGDKLKMLVSPVTPCFVYVVHQGPDDELSVLFPSPSAAFPPTYRAGVPFSVPSGSGWLTLDAQTGIERIYLVASSTRLTKLEELLKARKPAKEVIGELASLRRQYAKTDWVERPISVGGQVRGSKEPDITPFASEIAANTFFSRVFIIDHR